MSLLLVTEITMSTPLPAMQIGMVLILVTPITMLILTVKLLFPEKEIELTVKSAYENNVNENGSARQTCNIRQR